MPIEKIQVSAQRICTERLRFSEAFEIIPAGTGVGSVHLRCEGRFNRGGGVYSRGVDQREGAFIRADDERQFGAPEDNGFGALVAQAGDKPDGLGTRLRSKHTGAEVLKFFGDALRGGLCGDGGAVLFGLYTPGLLAAGILNRQQVRCALVRAEFAALMVTELQVCVVSVKLSAARLV